MTDTPEVEAPKSKGKPQKSKAGIELPLPLTAMVEALLFVSSEPVPVSQIAEALDVKLDAVEQSLLEIRDGADNVVRGVRLQRKGDKVQLTTHPECAPYIEKFLGLDLTSRLSKPALETLAIVAYQQPMTRAQIEQIRGVNCDGVLSTLLNKGLIEEVGRLETAGRPIQYGTTFAFLQHFGLRGLDDMPQLQPLEAATLDAMATKPEPVVVDAQMADQNAAATPPAPDAPASQPILETQLPLVPVDSPAPIEPAGQLDQSEADVPAIAALSADEAEIENLLPLDAAISDPIEPASQLDHSADAAPPAESDLATAPSNDNAAS